MISNQQNRLKFIEMLLYWEGGFTTKQVENQFDITRQQVGIDIKFYEKGNQQTIEYDQTRKQYVISDALFKPQLIPIRHDIYLHWFLTSELTAFELNPNPKGAYQIPLPERKVSPDVIQELVRAIRNKHRLEVDYVSVKSPNREGRIFHPHTFVNAGLRWHVRGYCEKNQQYRDFVLTRFRGRPESLEDGYQGVEHDDRWNDTIDVIIEPDFRLSKAKKKVVENDYNMINGQLIISTKPALVDYLLKSLQISTKMMDRDPDAQQLMVKNFEDIQPFLFS